MANIKITELDEALSITNNDYMVIDDGTSTKKYKASNMGQVDDVTVDGTSVVTNKVAVIDLSGKENADATILKQSNVVDNLSSDSSIYPLSAKQGKVLKTQSDRTDRSLDYLWKKSKGVIYDTEVVNGTTYDVDIPSGAMEYAECQMIGGMSRKGRNLLNYNLSKLQQINTAGSWNNNIYTHNGVTFTVNDNGTIIASGTSNNSNGSFLFLNSGIIDTLTSSIDYILNGCASNGDTSTYCIQYSNWTEGTSYVRYDIGSGVTIQKITDSTTQKIRIWVRNEVTVTNLLFKPMIRLSTDTDTSYEPYSSSLLDAKVDKQISYDSENSVIAEYPINSNIQALEGYGLGINNTCYNYVSFTPTTYHNMKSVDLGTLTWGGTSGAYTTTLSGYVGNPLHSSIPSTSFSYSGTTLTVNSSTTPSGILHYEATSGGTDYNAYLYHKKVGSVDLGSLILGYEQTNQRFNSLSLVDVKSAIRRTPMLSIPYTSMQNGEAFDSGWDMVVYIVNNILFIHNHQYTDVSTFITAMSGVMLYYELANEQILDITPYCEQDFNIREIEANGTLQNHYPLLDNGYGINMNSTLECMVEVSEVQ